MSFSIPDGSSSVNINIPIYDDTEVEGTETIIATISNLSNGSLGTDNASANIFDNDDSSDVESIKNNAISVFPNPVGDVLYISSAADIKEITVYDISGRVVYNKQFNVRYDYFNTRINTESFPSGVYFVKITSNQFSETKKLIIQ